MAECEAPKAKTPDISSAGGGVDALSLNRRQALASAAIASMAAADLGSAEAQVLEPRSGATTRLAMQVNGRRVEVPVDPRASLLDVLRDQLDLTGAKKGCDHGQCGACTIHLDGDRVASCLTLAMKAQDRAVLTIEGIARDGALHPMQQAFIDHDALQCGYCTPGQIMAAIACLREGHARDEAEIREYMSGNICRCGAYVGIVAAIRDAAARMEG